MNKKTKKTIFTVAAILIVCGLLFIWAIYSLVTGMFTKSIPYQYSLNLVKTNALSVEYLGSGIEQTKILGGFINRDLCGGEANFSYMVKGDKNSAQIYVNAVIEKEEWKYNKIILFKDGDTTQKIDLTADTIR